MFLTRISVNNPVFATMIMIALMVFGAYSFPRLSVEQLPDVDLPVVAVILSYPGASPEAVEQDLIKPVEDAVNSISGIDEVRSTAVSGSGTVLMTFRLEISSSEAMQEVRDRLSIAQASFPDGVSAPTVVRFDPDQIPIISVAVTSEDITRADLTELADDVVAQRLSSVPGVGSAKVVGGAPRVLEILLDPVRMASSGVTVSEVTQAVSLENRDSPAGAVTPGRSENALRVIGRARDHKDFEEMIVARRGAGPVRLGDVATVSVGEESPLTGALLDGRQAIAVDVIKTQGANTVNVARGVRDEVRALGQGGLPEGVSLRIVRDSAVAVEESYDGVRRMLVEGAVLATLIVMLFLNSWRSTVITGLTLPVSIIGSMTVLLFLGFTLNLLTMLALSIAVGLLIDDAIVVRENIMRHLREGKSHRQAALDGTREIGLAVLATTLSIVAVFLPVAFMDGIMGRFFLQFGVTVSVAVLLSMFVAFTLDPMLSSVWNDPSAGPGARRGPLGRFLVRFDALFVRLGAAYGSLLRAALRHRPLTLLIALLTLLGSVMLIPRVGAEFMPPADKAEFRVDVETPPGSSLGYKMTKARQAEEALRGLPEVVSTYATADSSSDTSTVIALMLPAAERPSGHRSPNDISGPAREVLRSVPGVTVSVSTADKMGGGGAPVQVSLFGPDPAKLERFGSRLADDLSGLPGLRDVQSSSRTAQPVLNVTMDYRAASDLGVTPSQAAAALRTMLSGEAVSDWTGPDGKSHDVTVRLPEGSVTDAMTLRGIPLSRTGSGETVRLGQVANITEGVGPTEIRRLDLSRQVTVSANLSGSAMSEVLPEIAAAINRLDLPDGYRAGTGGDAKQIAEAGAAAGSALLLAIALIYIVLASQFGSFLQPLAIMASLPLSLIGVMGGLLLGGSTLNIFSVIGLIMLMGLVVKNAILLVDNANQHVRSGENLYDALVEAGMTRFRPIIMTTMAMIFGMLPLALNLHGGSGQNAPMAHAVIGGLISSTILTLVVVPVVVTYTEALGVRVRSIIKTPPAQ